MKKLCLSVAILSLLFSTACKDQQPSKQVKTATISFTKNGELNLIKKDTDSIYKTLDIEIADDEYKTQTGLMYRDSMEEHQAMLFVFPDSQVRSFYMKNTAIALDILFIDSDQRIVSFQKDARPYDASPLASGVPSQYVLEIKAGLSNQWNIEVGDKISWKLDE
ncbi:DUF192 domain-containing protein [uncultured Planktosalinus sp.]|uniref:DUF192 domain-containing protein n=1 Tax=uncultured Planktosalinus sp. TaxID=1810935 RepID=UPI0030D816A3